jgi:hypothetical protein
MTVKESKPLKNPRGGLTAAGRKGYSETEGAHLRPGVTKAEKDMTPEDMKRKGSFLRRHYGRRNPFRLVDVPGKPTRYALQAQAWGERLPKTRADIERLAAKGHKLLEKAKRMEGSKARNKGSATRSASRTRITERKSGKPSR